MALSLSAEQKNLRSLFINDDRYIVPSFQRPYRWTKKEVKQLFDDITQAFYLKEDYFVGNIVIARGKDDTSTPQIIDGQQRILTLWMFLKVLAVITNVSPNHLDKHKFYPDEIGGTDLGSSEILSALIELELEGLVRALPGGRYEVTENN